MELVPIVSSFAVPLRFVVGLVAAVFATLVMDIVMARLPEGDTPPYVAAGVLTETTPGEAHGRLASVVHYLAGGLTGPLFVWFLLSAEALLDGELLPAAALATLVSYPLMVGFFVLVVLPRSQLPAQRVGVVRRDWAVSAAAYLAVLVPIVAAGSTVV